MLLAADNDLVQAFATSRAVDLNGETKRTKAKVQLGLCPSTVSFRLPQRSRCDCDLLVQGALSG